MTCQRCNARTEVITEYYDFVDECFVREDICSKCNSVLIETFYKDSRYKSDWIDLNV